MAKRRLSKQQQRRIADKQHSAAPDLINGLVVSHHGGEVDVIATGDNDAVDFSLRQRCHLRANLTTVVCGDRVKWRPSQNNSNTGVIEKLLDRDSVIERPRPYQDPKPVAANISSIVLVFAPSPQPISSLIDRYLIAAENAGIAVTLIVNKMDLINNRENSENAAIREEIDKLMQLYSELGYPVYWASAKQNRVYAYEKPDRPLAIDALFKDKTSIVVGQSGVGKSSLINAIMQTESAAVADVSVANDKGKHTTTTAELYFLDSDTGIASLNSAIIDSPGIREFGLWHLSPQEIVNGFREFRPITEQCQFRDCDHQASKGCALKRAFINGDIHPESSFQL